MRRVDEEQVARLEPLELTQADALDALPDDLDPELFEPWHPVRLDADVLGSDARVDLVPQQRRMRDLRRISAAYLDHPTWLKVPNHRVQHLRVACGEC